MEILVACTYGPPLVLGVGAAVLWMQHQEAPSRSVARAALAAIGLFTAFNLVMAATFAYESIVKGEREWGPFALFAALAIVGAVGLWQLRPTPPG